MAAVKIRMCCAHSRRPGFCEKSLYLQFVLVWWCPSPSQQLLLQIFCACSIPSAGGRSVSSLGIVIVARNPVCHHVLRCIWFVPKACTSDIEVFLSTVWFHGPLRIWRQFGPGHYLRPGLTHCSLQYSSQLTDMLWSHIVPGVNLRVCRVLS